MKTYSKELIESAVALRKLNLSIPQISLQLGPSRTTIARWTKEIKPTCATHPKYKTNSIKHDYFSEENLSKFPERFVIIGFIAADGCISNTSAGQRRLCFNICEKDKIALEIINREIACGERHLSFNKATKSFMWYVSSDQICNDLTKYNIIPRKTTIYDLPKLDSTPMSYFLRGYFYGDGCIYGRTIGTRGYYFVATPMFAKSLQFYLTENKILDRCNIFGKTGSSTIVQIHIKGRQGAKFSKFIFHDEKMMLLPRKHQIIEEVVHLSKWTDEEKQLLKITSIEEFCKITGRSKTAATSYKEHHKT